MSDLDHTQYCMATDPGEECRGFRVEWKATAVAVGKAERQLREETGDEDPPDCRIFERAKKLDSEGED